jgi:hypothetical protein
MAHGIQDIISESEPEEIYVKKVDYPQNSVNKEVPKHLTDLFTKSKEHILETEQSLLRDVLISYADDFATDEFDLGHFNAVKHSIYTDDARPLKQRLQRTPACYADEEEKHLNKLLYAGVI